MSPGRSALAETLLRPLALDAALAAAAPNHVLRCRADTSARKHALYAAGIKQKVVLSRNKRSSGLLGATAPTLRASQMASSC